MIHVLEVCPDPDTRVRAFRDRPYTGRSYRVLTSRRQLRRALERHTGPEDTPPRSDAALEALARELEAGRPVVQFVLELGAGGRGAQPLDRAPAGMSVIGERCLTALAGGQYRTRQAMADGALRTLRSEYRGREVLQVLLDELACTWLDFYAQWTPYAEIEARRQVHQVAWWFDRADLLQAIARGYVRGRVHHGEAYVYTDSRYIRWALGRRNHAARR